MIYFEFVNPPLPVLQLRHPATYDLAATIRAIYPNSFRLGSMIRLSADHFLDVHRDEPTVSGWLFARYCDLLSIDRVMVLGGIGEAVPRPVSKPLWTTAAGAAETEAQSLSLDPQQAAATGCGLYWHTADRVGVISTRSTASIILDVPGALQ